MPKSLSAPHSDDLPTRRKRPFVVVAGMSILAGAILLTSVGPLISFFDSPQAEAPATRNAVNLEALEQAVAARPTDLQALLALANGAYDAAAYKRASEVYARYLTLRPDNADARVDYGTTLLYQGRAEEAIAAYHATLKQSPHHLNAHLNLGVAYRALGDKARCRSHWQKALALAVLPEQKSRIEGMLQNL